MVTKQEVKQIANLSKLYLSESELETGIEEINSMIKFVDSINKMEKFTECQNSSEEISNAFREDEVAPSFSREEILKNVQGGKDGFFYLSKSE